VGTQDEGLAEIVRAITAKLRASKPQVDSIGLPRGGTGGQRVLVSASEFNAALSEYCALVATSKVIDTTTVTRVNDLVHERRETYDPVNNLLLTRNLFPKYHFDGSHLIVEGDVFLNDAVATGFDFGGTEFRGRVTFTKVRAVGAVNENRFVPSLILEGTTFVETVEFIDCDIDVLDIFNSHSRRNIGFERCRLGRLEMQSWHCQHFFLDDTTIEAGAVCNAGSQGSLSIANLRGEFLFDTGNIGSLHCRSSKIHSDRFAFRSVTFLRDADFRGTTFVGWQEGRRASVDFRGCVFQEALRLSHCTFAVPLLCQGMTVNGLLDLRYSSFHVGRNIDVVESFRAIRGIAKTKRDQLLESYMFSLEQRATIYALFELGISQGLRTLVKNLPEVLAGLIYDAFCRYGHSVGRPVGWFAILAVVTALVLHLGDGAALNVGAVNLSGAVGGLAPAIGLAVQNIVNPLVLFSDKAVFVPTTTFALVLCLLHTIMSIVLLAFFLIALRRRFHKAAE
jgi:hypothetical protein